MIVTKNCKSCGSILSDRNEACPRCNISIIEVANPQTPSEIIATPLGPPAGIWRRLVAHLVDSMVLAIPLAILYIVVGLGTAETLLELPFDVYPLVWLGYTPVPLMFFIIPATLLFSFYDGVMLKFIGTTIGKRVVGIYIVDENSRRISLRQAFLRSVIKYAFSFATIWVAFGSAMFIGYVWALIVEANIDTTSEWAYGEGFWAVGIIFISGILFSPPIYALILTLSLVIRRDRRAVHDLMTDTYPIRYEPPDGWVLR